MTSHDLCRLALDASATADAMLSALAGHLAREVCRPIDWPDYRQEAEWRQSALDRLDAMLTDEDPADLRCYVGKITVTTGVRTVVSANGERGYWQIYHVEGTDAFVPLSRKLIELMDGKARRQVESEREHVEFMRRECVKSDEAAPHCSRMGDEELAGEVLRLSEAKGGSGLQGDRAAVGALEIIRRRLVAAGVSDPWKDADARMRREREILNNKRDAANLRKALDAYRRMGAADDNPVVADVRERLAKLVG